jgi:hypothetical protein
MTTISATSILASMHARTGQRVDTLLLRYPRVIHSEFMTHRCFSRNAASSRAIPVEKIIQSIIDDPFIPLVWGKNQKGMQSSEECNEPVQCFDRLHIDRDSRISFLANDREDAWRNAMIWAIEHASAFDKAGYHKQIINRLLEPFSHITVVVTGDQWSNFLALRDHPAAEPHIQILAKRVREALDGAEVQTLQPGQWHLPFTDYHPNLGLTRLTVNDFIKLSVARCASTSYKTVDGFDMTLERAIALHDKLVADTPLHASPCEHILQADEQIWVPNPNGITRDMVASWRKPELSGNLKPGWIQYRKTLRGECL